MSENKPPRFTVIDRRKYNATGDQPSEPVEESTPAPSEEPAPGPRLVVPNEEPAAPAPEQPAATAEEAPEAPLPPRPSDEQAAEQKTAYEASSQKLEDMLRSSNPGMPKSETIGFDHLVQQLYLSAMYQMGAGTPEGERPRVDILGARQTIDMITVLSDKTKGNLTDKEKHLLDTVLFELRMAFLELTNMISHSSIQPPPEGTH